MVIDTTIVSDNSSHFRENILERIQKLIIQLMIRLEMKNYNTILTEKPQKCQHYHHVKLINMNVLQAKKYCHLIKSE